MKNKNKSKKDSRRRFLKKSLLAGVGAATGVSMMSGLASGKTKKSEEKIKLLTPDGKLVEVDRSDVHHPSSDNHPISKEEARLGIPGRKFVMVIDLAKCKNARKCVEECQKAHNLPPDHEWITVYLLKDSIHTEPYWFPKPCFHCDNPPCVKICPVGATYKRQDGIVLVDVDRCIGCKFCMTGCPFSSRVFNWKEPDIPEEAKSEPYSPETNVLPQIGTVGKCDFCPDMIRKGEVPHCVTACPNGALYFGDLNEDAVSNGTEVIRFSEIIRDYSGYRYAEELGTEPSVYYLSPVNRLFPVERGFDDLSEKNKARYKNIL